MRFLWLGKIQQVLHDLPDALRFRFHPLHKGYPVLFVQFVVEFVIGLGDHGDIVQRIRDLVGHTGRQDAERRKFLGLNDLLFPVRQFLGHGVDGCDHGPQFISRLQSLDPVEVAS
jgi:hypothetical protein